MWIKKSAALLLLAAFVQAEKLPEWLVPCYRDDPGFNDCATKTGQTAIPKLIPGDAKLRVPPLDPLEVTEIHVPKDANTLGIDFLMRDVKLYGLSKAELREFRVDFEKKHIAYSIYTPVLTFLCTYNVSGSILLLPIAGNGPANITLINVLMSYGIDYDLEKKKHGKEYMVLKNGHLDFNMTKAHMHFENFFGGNKMLGDAANAYMQYNQDEIIKEIGPGVAQSLALAVKQIFVRLSNMFTFDETFPLKPK